MAEVTTILPVCKFSAHRAYITRVLLSPDVRQLATCSADHTARIWKVDTSITPADALSIPEAPLTEEYPESPGIVTTTSSAYKTANTDPALQHNHAQQQNSDPLSPPPPHTSTVRDPVSGETLREAAAFELEAQLGEHQRWVWDCAFSADSAYLVTACSDHYARLWDLAEQRIIRQYQGHHRGLVCVALNDYSEVRG